jgi:hypothetical protein
MHLGKGDTPCTDKCNGHQTSIVIVRNTKDWTNPFDTSTDDDNLSVVWGTDTHEVMHTTAADWDTEDMTTTAANCWDFDD